MFNPVDGHVGGRIRQRRLFNAMTIDALAQAIGVSPLQLAAYEAGTDRVPADRLFNICQVLRMEVTEIFHGLAANVEKRTGSPCPRN